MPGAMIQSSSNSSRDNTNSDRNDNVNGAIILALILREFI